jgi:hypothetical protein
MINFEMLVAERTTAFQKFLFMRQITIMVHVRREDVFVET